MSANRKLWLGLGALLAVSFSVLLWVGTEIHRVMPPIPAQVVSEDGEVLYTRADIEKGRQVWQSIGGHQLGSIWGHGSYVAPDWTADWLHREAVEWLDRDALDRHGTTTRRSAPTSRPGPSHVSRRASAQIPMTPPPVPCPCPPTGPRP